MLDGIFVADPIEDVMEGVFVAGAVGKLDAVVGQRGMGGIGHRCDQIPQVRFFHFATVFWLMT